MSPVELKLQRVKEAMGDKYCCHPSRQVKRRAEPLVESSGTDIRRTFERAKPVIVVEGRK